MQELLHHRRRTFHFWIRPRRPRRRWSWAILHSLRCVGMHELSGFDNTTTRENKIMVMWEQMMMQNFVQLGPQNPSSCIDQVSDLSLTCTFQFPADKFSIVHVAVRKLVCSCQTTININTVTGLECSPEFCFLSKQNSESTDLCQCLLVICLFCVSQFWNFYLPMFPFLLWNKVHNKGIFHEIKKEIKIDKRDQGRKSW